MIQVSPHQTIKGFMNTGLTVTGVCVIKAVVFSVDGSTVAESN